MKTCGTDDSKKMLKVLRSAVQKFGWPSTLEKLLSPTNSPLPPIRFQSCNETQAVYPSGNRPTMAKRMKNGEM